MVTRQATLFSAILLVYLVAGVLYVTLTPLWQSPDEPAHYNYVGYLVAHTGYPELTAGCYNQSYLNRLTREKFPPHLPLDSICYEFHQPPLYYQLAAPVFVAGAGAPLALRLFSVVLGAGVVVLAFYIGRTIFPRRTGIAFGAMAFAAFVPMHVAMLASANNDALAELILAAIMLLLVRRLCVATPPGTRNNFHLGILLGLGLLTKVTVYIAIPLIGITLIMAGLPGRKPEADSFNWPKLLKQAVVIFGVALVIAAPWYLRNLNVYGGFDILGLQRHDEIVTGQLRAEDYLGDVGVTNYVKSFATTTFRSFWGQFGWMAVPMDGRTYRLLTVLVIVAGAGAITFIGSRWKNPAAHQQNSPAGASTDQIKSSFYLTRCQRHCLLLMAAAILLMGLGYGWYNLTFVQFQGRYLFPGLIPTGIFFALGLSEALSPRRAWWLAGALLAALGWIAPVSWSSGELDKWATLILGAFLSIAVGRMFAPRCQPAITTATLVACYAGLALLTLFSPFWFIVPYL